MPENIVEKLHRVSHRYATTTADVEVAIVMNEAADEIEYLRQRCIEIDNEWRMSIENETGGMNVKRRRTEGQ